MGGISQAERAISESIAEPSKSIPEHGGRIARPLVDQAFVVLCLRHEAFPRALIAVRLVFCVDSTVLVSQQVAFQYKLSMLVGGVLLPVFRFWRLRGLA